MQKTDQAFSSAIIKNIDNSNNAKFNHVSEYREERYFASVWVQLFLFLNVYFTGFWLISNIIILYYEYFNLSAVCRLLSILSLIISAPVECLRLYLGYSGNLLDKVPDFAGFWILSVFIQTPIQIYLLTSQQILTYKMGLAIQGIQCALLFLQIVSSFTVIRRASEFRREQFANENKLMTKISSKKDDKDSSITGISN